MTISRMGYCAPPQWFTKIFSKILFSRTDFPSEIISARITNVVTFANLLRRLSTIGFSNVVEIGPGPISNAALAIKSSLLTGRMRYTAIEASVEYANQLETFLDAINVRSSIIIQPFLPLDFDRYHNSLFIFDHSLEDLYLLGIGTNLAITSNSWEEFTNILFKYQRLFTVTSVTRFLNELFGSFASICNNTYSAFIVNHFRWPESATIHYMDVLDESFIYLLPMALDNSRIKWTYVEENTKDRIIIIGGFIGSLGHL